MAEDKDRAEADVPAEVTVDDADLVDMGLEDLDSPELTESEQVAKAAAKARPARKQADGKGHATPSRHTATQSENKRATPVQFVRESVAELKKVVWPTWSQLQQYFVVVLVFVLIMIAIVFFLDLGFGALILKIFGNSDAA